MSNITCQPRPEGQGRIIFKLFLPGHLNPLTRGLANILDKHVITTNIHVACIVKKILSHSP